MKYAEKLLDPRWQKKRLEILERDDFCCIKCGDNKTTLHVHHSRYSQSGNPWEVENKFLHTYCEDCHALVEFNKKHLSYTDLLEWIKVKTSSGGVNFIVLCFDTDDNQMVYRFYSYVDKSISFLMVISIKTFSYMGLVFNDWKYLVNQESTIKNNGEKIN